MKRFNVMLLVGVFAWTGCLGSVQARPKYPPLFIDYYKDNAGLGAAAKEAKCNVCHDPKDKKVRNEYGKAVNKNLTKTDFDMLKDNADGLKKKVGEALKAAEADKHSSGKTFG